MNKTTRILLSYILLLVYLALSFGFAQKQHQKLLCNDIVISITDSLDHRFIHHDDVLNMLENYNLMILGDNLQDINAKKLEQFFNAQPYIKNTEIYTASDGKIFIEITQRDPMLRIINAYNESYYIDTEGNILPPSANYSAHIIVANGNIPDRFDLSLSNNIFTQKVSKQLTDAYAIANYISKDEFWNAQIVQIYTDKNFEFDLIPRIGPHIITLGSVDNLVGKIKKLDVLYRKGFNNIGWNKYLHINLKYNNQVICTKG